MKKFIVIASLIASLLAPYTALAQSNIYLPIVRHPFQPEMRIAHFDGARADECLSSMGEVGPAAAICPLPGNYFALADGAQIAIGGRQGNGADVGWKSPQGSYTLIRPLQTVNDAAVVAIDGAGQYSNDALFGTKAGSFKVIRHSFTAPVGAAAIEQGRMFNAADFAEAMRGLYTEGQNLTASLTAGTTFWDETMTSSFTARQCGYDKATWYFIGRLRFNFTATGLTFLAGGKFTDPVLDRCMNVHRYIDVRTLMLVPEAADIQTSVREFRRGQTPLMLEWVTVPGGATYGFWSAMSGGIAYYAYLTLNSAKQVMQTTFFIAIPDPYKLECMAQETAGKKECVVFK